MGTRGYEYNQIRIGINIIMGSQIPIYYTRGYPFSYTPRARDGFYPRVPLGMVIFATPTLNILGESVTIEGLNEHQIIFTKQTYCKAIKD